MKTLYYAIIGATALALAGDAYAKKKKTDSEEPAAPRVEVVHHDSADLMAIIYTSRRSFLEEQLKKAERDKTFYVRTCTPELEAFPICSKERLGLLYREFSELQAELQKLDIDYQLASIEAPENRETKGLQDTYRQKCYKKRGKGTNATFCQELGGMIIAEEAKER